MSKTRGVNEFVRRRLRELRQSKRMRIKDLAQQSGIPTGSYGCMESGFYNISLDNLFRMLGVLEADIHDVWPVESVGSQTLDQPVYLRKIQEFRLSEIVSLSGAEGAALFCLEEEKCKVLLYQNLSDFLIDRLHFYLEDGRSYDQGLWFEKQHGDQRYCLFLHAKGCAPYLRQLIEHYLVVWAHVFNRLTAQEIGEKG